MKTTLSLLAVLAVAACANPESNDAPTADGMTMDAPKAATVSLNISGMTWGAGCPPAVRSALASLDGIEESDVDVDYAAKTCSVSVADTDLNSADLVAAFEGTRFSATVN